MKKFDHGLTFADTLATGQQNMKKVCVLLGLLAAGHACAQDFEAGRNGWQLERLSANFVLLRTSITIPVQGSRPSRQGLLILTCEPGVRRIRFQIGDLPRSPSTHASSHGRAIVRGWFQDQVVPLLPVYPNVLFFDDGSFEFRETIAFSDSVMRGILGLLRKNPARLEIVLFKGPETRAFQSGTAMQFRLHGLDRNLGDIYGFEGLCFHTGP
ncbi:hypothetical protein [Microvirga brassicacearum]|uniref:Uncharacterized protein n=1 Tax=Microvirga brassicacearum TaxID=2580413 RepID=A0A5N3P7Q8_9HYPH|nr:hypothetical protein [Microvirga brassicacearum]KAB0265756.1 hypothetical protein FEZ63_17260 [Microvirga brassicacearum]